MDNTVLDFLESMTRPYLNVTDKAFCPCSAALLATDFTRLAIDKKLPDFVLFAGQVDGFVVKRDGSDVIMAGPPPEVTTRRLEAGPFRVFSPVFDRPWLLLQADESNDDISACNHTVTYVILTTGFVLLDGNIGQFANVQDADFFVPESRIEAIEKKMASLQT